MTIKSLRLLDQDTINRLSNLGEHRRHNKATVTARIKANRELKDTVSELQEWDDIWPDNQINEVK